MRWVLLLSAITFNVAANLMLKRGGSMLEETSEASRWLNPWIIGGVVCSGVLLITYTLSLRYFPVSVAYPIVTSLALVFVFLGSVATLGETVTPDKFLGLGLIIAGVIIRTTRRILATAINQCQLPNDNATGGNIAPRA